MNTGKALIKHHSQTSAMLIKPMETKYNDAILKIILEYERKMTINFSISYNNAEKRFYRIIYTRMAAD